ncbi:MAG: outer membrane lipoprotein LolB [Methylococcaceae bacterium]|nr:outer membrane lipoprotein LolB [Methylococcaceae bacterium]
MRLATFVLGVLLLTQVGCSFITEKPQQNYQLSARQNVKVADAWAFEGRIVISDQRDTVTASIIWVHRPASDVIDLSGPLAQGHVKISVSDSLLQIDDGDQSRSFEGDAEQIMAEQLAFVPIEEGFGQLGWSVKYKSMQKVNELDLPYKMSAENEKTRLKLIVDQWNIL